MTIFVLFLLLAILLTIAFIIIAGLIIYFRIKQKAKDFSQLAFGTPSLSKGIADMNREYQSTPKSVSAMTSLYLPRITKDFPDFSYQEMKVRAENLLTTYLLAISNRKIPEFGTLVGNELLYKLRNMIQLQEASKRTEHYDQITIHQSEISAFKKEKGRYIITFQASLQAIHYLLDDHSQLLDGSKDIYEQSRYELDLLYIQDRDYIEQVDASSIGLTCPNCGAPLSGIASTQCEYCGSPLVAFNIMTWTFCDIRKLTN